MGHREGGHVTSSWTVVASNPSDDPAPMEAGRSPPPLPSSTKPPGDSAMDDAPPSRGERTASQVENNAAFRDRFRIASFVKQPAAGPGPHVSTPADIENAFREPVQQRPAGVALCPAGDPRLASGYSSMRSSVDGVSSRPSFNGT